MTFTSSPRSARSAPIASIALLLALSTGVVPAHAQTVLSEAHTIAAATTAVPVEETFTVTTAGTYTVALSDLGAQLTPPAPLASVKLAVTNSSNALVGTVLVGAGTLTLASLAADTYVLHVVGMPGNTPGSGPIGIQVNSGATQIASFQDILALPSQALPNGEAVLDGSFTVASSGNYTVTLTDLALPQSLTTLSLLLIAQGGTTPLATLSAAGTTPPVALTTGVTYDIFAVGAAGAPANAGLFGATVAPSGGGAVVFGRAIPVGSTVRLGSPALAAGSATLTLTDLAYPAALSQLETAVTLTGTAVAQLAAAGQQSFTAVSGTYDVFAYAGAAAAAPGAGGYALQLTQAGGAALSVARAVLAAGSSESVYDFDSTIATAGSYTLSLADFQFPAALSTVNLAVVQGGALLGTPLPAAGNNTVNAAAGPISILTWVQATSAAGLFGVELTPAAGGTPAFETTQAVGAVFSSQQLTITAAGAYAVTAADLGFPASFANYDTIVTQGTQSVGSIFGGGTFNFNATAGTYFVNFIAQPAGTDEAGTYALTVAVAPPAPTVSLTVDNSQVTSGGTVDLIWSSQNATSCSGTPSSGGWGGTLATHGTVTSGALTSSTTFTLTCTGAGGTTSQSVNVTIAPPSKSGGGGGIDAGLLAALLALLAGRSALRRGRVPGTAPAGTRGARALLLPGLLAAALAVTSCGGPASRYASHMERGRDYFARSDFTHASVEFRNAMQIAPKSAEARLLAGHTAEKLGRGRDAVGLYASAIELAPDNVEARVSLGRLYVLGGAPDKALSTLAPALARNADNAELLTVRAAARLAQKDFTGGRADVTRALELAPANEDAIGLLAGLEREQGHPERAVKLVSDGLANLPDSLALREMLVDLYQGAGELPLAEEQLGKLITLRPQQLGFRYQLAGFYVRAGKPDAAQQTLEQAVAAVPKSDEAKLVLADFIARQRTASQAEATLRRFIAAAPHDEDLRLGLGALLQRSGSDQEARQVYTEVIQLDDTGPAGLTARDRMAAIDAARSQFPEAEKLLGEVLQHNPHDNDALFLRGRIELALQHPAEAIADLRAVLRDQPGSIAAHRLLARAHLANGEPTLAEEQLHLALDAAPADAGVRRELAQLLTDTRRPEQAVPVLEEGVRRNPTDVATRAALVQAYLQTHDLTAAHKAAEDVKTLAPKAAMGYFLAGVVAQAEERPAEGERQFEQALALEPGAAEPLAALTRLQLARGESARAESRLKSLLAADPKNDLALELLGEAYLSTHALPQAIDTFNREIVNNPRRWQPYRNLAVARAASNDIAGAIDAYQAGIKADPAQPQLTVELASYYEKQNRIDDAIALYEALHQRDPRLPLAANNLAVLLATYRTDKASLDRARDLTAAFASSDDGRLLDTRGWVSFKCGDVQGALPVLKRALAREPESNVIHYHLALAELQSGARDDARANLERALAGAANFPGADQARQLLSTLKAKGAG